MGGRSGRIIGINWSTSFEIAAAIASAMLKNSSSDMGRDGPIWVTSSSKWDIDLLSFLAKITMANVIFPLKDRRAVNLERIGVKSVCSNY